MTQNWEIAKFCIENAADLDALDSEQSTALIEACKFNNLEIVKMLILAGATVNIQNQYDKTAIAKAIAHHPQNYELIEFLLENGANPFLEEKYKRDDPRISCYSAYEYAVQEIKDPYLIALLERYRHK